MAAVLKALKTDGARSVDICGVVEPTPIAPWNGFADFKRTFGGT